MWMNLGGVTLSETRERKTETVYFNVYMESKKQNKGDSLAVQWLGLRASTAEGPGLDPWSGNQDPIS